MGAFAGKRGDNRRRRRAGADDQHADTALGALLPPAFFPTAARTLSSAGRSVALTGGFGVAGPAAADGKQGTWTGEIVDLACYVPAGAKGPDHAGCAKSCVKNGQPMGLLTDDGTLVLLAADHKNGAPFEALKDLAGEKAEVTGTLAEKDGMKVVTVLGVKKAA